MTQRTQRKAPMQGEKKVSRIGCGRMNLGKPSSRVDAPREMVRTELAKLIEQVLPRNSP